MTHTGIECFLAVCRYKTISQAAEALYITQPSLSTRLKNLEQELGGALFIRHRGRRELALTNAGKEFYKLALQYEDITQKMLQVCSTQHKPLRISSINSLGTYLLTQVYDKFMQTHPQVELQIQDMQIESASRSLLAGKTDIAFTTGTTSNRYLIQRPLYREKMVLICSSSLKLEGTVSPAVLKQHQELYIDWTSPFELWHRKHFGSDYPSLSISLMDHLRQFMEQKPCWAIVPISVANGLEKTSGVRRLNCSVELPYRDISILTSSEQSKSPAIAAFLNCLQAVLADNPDLEPI